MRRWAWISGVALLLIGTSCRQQQPKTGLIQIRIENRQKEVQPVVSFGIEPDGTQSADRWKYKASYTRNGKTARFGIDFVLAKTSAEESRPRSGSGSLIADSRSLDNDLLEDLKKTLKATAPPQNRIHVHQLPFRFFIEGENMDRGRNGDLIDAATGNWVKTKLFFGPQQDQEVYFNFQRSGGTGEFVMADPAFGNAVLQELAKVL